MTANQPLVIERTLNASATKVWQALTDIKILQQWSPFWPDFKPEVGFETEFILGPDKQHQYRHHVKVLEIVDGQKLSYGWDYGGMSPESKSTFELFAKGDVTRLVLTCQIASVPTDQPDFLKNASEGWNYIVDALKKFIEVKEG